MAILVECPSCGALVPQGRAVCSAKKCGAPMPDRGRMYWLDYWIPRPGDTPQRKRERLGAVSLQVARDTEHNRKKAIKEGEYAPGKPAIKTLGEVFAPYLQSFEVRGSRYTQTVRLFLARMEKTWGAATSVASITPPMIRNLQRDLLETGLSPATVDRHLAAGKAAWNYAGVEPNPFSRVRLYRPDNTLVRFLTAEEEALILAAAREINPRVWAMLCVELGTGLRIQNVMRLKRDEVDFTHGVITIVQKGGKRHSVPMNAATRTVLESVPENGTPFFWLNATTGRPYGSIKTTWKTIKRKAGITRPFRIHDLRHHVATKLTASGESLRVVQLYLGHSQSQVTEKYAHVMPEFLRKAAESLSPTPGQKIPPERE